MPISPTRRIGNALALCVTGTAFLQLACFDNSVMSATEAAAIHRDVDTNVAIKGLEAWSPGTAG